MFRSTISVVLLLTVLQLIIKEAHFQRREQTVSCVPGRTQFPNPNDRHSFFKCDAGGNPVIFQCPAGTWFNPRLEVCDWDRSGSNDNSGTGGNNRPNGNGGTTTTSRPTPSTSRPTPTTSRPTPRPNPWDNDDIGPATPSSNPVDWWNNPPVPEVSPSFAGETGNDDAVIPTLNGQCTSRDPMFAPNPDDCSTFLICSNGRYNMSSCSQGQFFDSQRNRCDSSVPQGCTVRRRRNNRQQGSDNVWEFRRFGGMRGK